MIDKLAPKDCCGCNACGDICPKSAISFHSDNEGFLYPQIDQSVCIKCELCEQVCPSIHAEDLKKNDFEKPVCFAAINKNLNIRFDSTSGGAFSALAKKAYQKKYYVGGAVWNEDWSVSHFISNNKKDLERLRSSKYIQSNSQGIYIQIRDLLKKGEKILICGTPCQIAGLKSFLKKDYTNLVTIDFVCQYVNSPLIWHKYIEYLENQHQSKVRYIKDKNKELGWRKLCNKVIFENGDVVYDLRETNHFRRCYMQLGVASRPACYHCKFKGFPRISDITIADFWGSEKYVPKEFDNDLGTSLILCNSQRGLDYFDDEVRKNMLIQSVDLQDTIAQNSALIRPYISPTHCDRTAFYKDLAYSDIKTVVDNYINKTNASRFSDSKKRIKNCLRFFKAIFKSSGCHLGTIYKNLKYNLFSQHIVNNIFEGHFLVLYPHCILSLQKGAKIKVQGLVQIGKNEVRKEIRSSKIFLKNNAFFDIQGDYTFGAGCDIQVLENAIFTIEGGGDTNNNIEIVCGQNITFQPHVFLGRNVIIRDTNGQHFLSRQGYKTSRPVIIGAHAWLCDRATIMPGVHVWPGGIVGANSFVSSDVPAFSMVSGNPCRLVDEEIYWKA